MDDDNRILQRARDFIGIFDFSDYNEKTILLKHQMLSRSFREFVIKKIKEPLRRVLILLAKRLPEPTKENTIFRNTKVWLNIRDKFFEYERNRDREEMERAVFKIGAIEIEHDIYYQFRFDWLIEEIVKAILKGEWKPRPEGYPEEDWWLEPKPYGGKHSIVYKMQLCRDEINKILENVDDFTSVKIC